MVMKKILDTLRAKWAEYLLEIVVIVIGILGAFALNNWNEQRKQDNQARTYMAALHLDFLQNEAFIQETLNQLEGTKRAAKSLSVFIEKGFVPDTTPGPVVDSGFVANWSKYVNTYIPIRDTASLLHNLNRSTWLTNYDLLIPTWNEIIGAGQMDLIDSDTIKKSIVNLHFAASEAEELETKVMTPIVRDYKAYQAQYFNVSRSQPIPEVSVSYGLFTDEAVIDISGLRNSEDFKYHLQRVYRAANESQSLIGGMVRQPSQQVLMLLELETEKY